MVMRWMGRRGAIFPFSGLSFYPRVNLAPRVGLERRGVMTLDLCSFLGGLILCVK